MFGNPETTTGGRALKFYASVRLDIRRIAAIKDGDAVVGNRTKVKVVKNKVASPFREAEFDIIYGEGVSKEGDLLDLGVAQNIIEKSGSWFSYKGERIGQGRENARQFLKDNPDIRQTIDTELRKALGLIKPDGGRWRCPRKPPAASRRRPNRCRQAVDCERAPAAGASEQLPTIERQEDARSIGSGPSAATGAHAGSLAPAGILLPTGFAALDAALGIGGFPRGRMIELFGPSSSGKTTLALQCVAHVQKGALTAAWIDADHTFDPAYAAALGVAIERCRSPSRSPRSRPWKWRARLAASGAVDLVVIDSAAALVPRARTGNRHWRERTRTAQPRAGIGTAKVASHAAAPDRPRLVSEPDANRPGGVRGRRRDQRRRPAAQTVRRGALVLDPVAGSRVRVPHPEKQGRGEPSDGSCAGSRRGVDSSESP